MRPETALGGAAVVVVAVALVGTLLVPGVLASPPDDPEPPGRLNVREVSIAAGPASGATATLQVDARLEHRGGESRNVTVEFRAVDRQSGMTATTRRVPVGNVTADGEHRVQVPLPVPREGGYRIRTLVYEGPERVASASTTVQGVGSLQPDYADTGMTFHRFEKSGAGLPTVAYRIADQSGDRATLDAWTYLTNAGDGTAGGVTLELIARQTDSGIVADRETVSVGEVRPGRTVTPGAELTVPTGYNYYLDAILKKDGVVVDTARSGASLNPNISVEVDRNRSEGGLQVGEFQQDDGEDGRDPTQTPEETGPSTDGGSGPGFGPVAGLVALLALLALGLYGGRHDND